MVSRDERVAQLAAKNDGVLTRGQLKKLRVSDEMIQRALKRKRWQQLQRGVYLLSAANPTWRQRVRAAALAAGEDAQVACRTLAAWLKLDGAVENAIELAVPYGKGPTPKGTTVRRTRNIGPTRRYDGVAGSTIERLLVDYTAVVPVGLAERAVESALCQGLTAERRIWRELATLGEATPGVRRLVQIMELRPEGKAARSTLELDLLRLIRNSDVPLPTRNHDVYVDGEHFEIDLAYVTALGAVEADSIKHHSTRTQRANDRRRQAKLEAAGWTFVRAKSTDIYGRPEWVIEQIRGLLCAVVAA
jgi:hypothetical protein